MHIAFLHNNYESLGIGYLSSFLKNSGHRTSLCFEPGLFGSFFAHNTAMHRVFDFRKEIIRQLKDLDPDAVCFSVISDNYNWACNLALEIKNKLGKIIIFGGIHPTSVPEKVLEKDFIDFVIRGEGEDALLELLNVLESGKPFTGIDNLAFRKNLATVINPLRPPIKDLDSLPFPDKRIFFDEFKGLVRNSYMIVASRGCAYNCSYCVNSVVNKLYPNNSYFRMRSSDNVVDELKTAKREYGIKRVTFYDENFTLDKKWLKEFLPKYKKGVSLPFFCCIHPSNIDSEMAEQLGDAGCTTVNVGIQTYSEDYRKKFLNRSGSNKDIKSALSIFRKTRIFVYSNVILGMPLQDDREILDTLKFCADNKSDIAAIYWLRYYPKTEIVKIAKRNGVLGDSDIKAIESSSEYLPYAIKGNTYNRQAAKMGNLILFASILPVSWVNAAINKRLYRFVPSCNLLFPAIVFIGMWKRISQRKKQPFHYFGLMDYLYFYLFYFEKKISGIFKSAFV